MRVFYPNFSFEDRLAGRRSAPAAALQRTLNSLAPLMGLCGRSGDIVLVDDSGRPSEIPPRLSAVSYLTLDELRSVLRTLSDSVEVVPWGWDDAARQLAMAIGHSTPIPPAEAVREVNSRRFSAKFDGVTSADHSPGFDGFAGRLCRSEREFLDALKTLSESPFEGWVAKPAWSASGRSRLNGRGVTLNTHQRRWLRKQLDDQEYVWLEPWLEVIRECGLQLQIAPDQSGKQPALVDFIGAAELHTDRAGRYRGSVVTGLTDPVWEPAVSHAMEIGWEASRLGYFGPLGVDCMEVRLPDGSKLLRRSHDINGRLTMGRLALQLSSELREEETAVWLHSAVGQSAADPASEADSPSDAVPDDVEFERVSPALVGGLPPQVETRLYVVKGPQKPQNLLDLLPDSAGFGKDGCDSRGVE